MHTLPSDRFRRVYVWELPVRVYHWVNALALVILIATGYLIGNPVSLGGANEAYQQFWFGTVRFTHFVAGFVLFFVTVFRFYWGFVGNRFARWDSFVLTSRKRWHEMWETLKTDILQTQEEGRIALGHNGLAGLSYFVCFLAFLFVSFTGLALYSSMSSFWFAKLFSWVIPLMGGEMAVRQWHHASMWFFVLFIPIHIYLVFYHDYVEGRGEASSIMGGWKFEREDVLERR